MGKLRIEPKVKSMDPSTYREYAALLSDARAMAIDSHLFYDLEDGEDKAKTKRDMMYVAEKEGIGLQVRSSRGQSTLQLVFGGEPVSGQAPKRRRTSANEAQTLILEALATQAKPMKRREILRETGISLPSWNIQIRSLLEQNRVSKTGVKSDTVYFLV
jgi:hypothetical protein